MECIILPCSRAGALPHAGHLLWKRILMLYTVVKDIGNVRVVQVLVENIMFDNYEQVFNRIKLAISQDDNWIVLDLARVAFMDSLNLGMLVPLLLYARRFGGALAIINPKPIIHQLFTTLSLDKIIPVYDNVEEAAAAFKTLAEEDL